ncbi:extracellular solute-binding protein [Cellulomonas edaphi]|uniref:Extracellular solute-binding protein n=1 Tax=Cellulomonas edaphi TaxID=3053468 RepID=A0ABT7S3F8_9CELL|nr:extracellular solute-binding protein [Cellulomons edaphi]MDM7830064.1 extracellular solute-binding protein [Cellulomons edaphi]
MRGKPALGILGVVALTALAGCSDDGSSSGDDASGGATTVKVAYQKTTAFHQLDDMLQKAKTEFEAAHKGITIDLQPIEAEQDQYFTKLALMNGSDKTAPDVIYEDTFQIRSDAAAGYLLPIDEYLGKWEDWGQFYENAKQAGLGDDGKTYGVSMGTDTRALFYNKDIFAKAGLPADWQPKSWDDVLAAARAVKEKVPDVTPLNVYAGKAAGEATTMQGFEMLLYGTADTLYDTDQSKWVVGSQGFKDSLGFLETIYKDKLAPPLDQALDASIGSRVSTELLPQGKLAIALDGSWLPGGWISGENAWPEWDKTMGFAKMPTQNGDAPGATSMSGGWTLAVGSHAKNPQAAFDFITTALNKENTFKYDTENSQIAVRKDVAEDPAYTAYNPSFEFFSSLVDVTHFRPATPDYSQISSNIQVAAEAMATGQQSPEDAAKAYDTAVKGIVGDDKTTTG